MIIKLRNLAAILAATVAIASCATAPAAAPAAAAPADKAPAADAAPAVAATAADGCLLAADFGEIELVLDRDTAMMTDKPKSGATATVTELNGRKGILVTRNSEREIRLGFKLKTPASLAGYTKIQFSIAGFDGYYGHYNVAVLYNEKSTNNAKDRMGSFYMSKAVKTSEWTDVVADLKSDEEWGKNFKDSRELYGIQLWSGQAKQIIITDVKLIK